MKKLFILILLFLGLPVSAELNYERLQILGDKGIYVYYVDGNPKRFEFPDWIKNASYDLEMGQSKSLYLFKHKNYNSVPNYDDSDLIHKAIQKQKPFAWYLMLVYQSYLAEMIIYYDANGNELEIYKRDNSNPSFKWNRVK